MKIENDLAILPSHNKGIYIAYISYISTRVICDTIDIQLKCFKLIFL